MVTRHQEKRLSFVNNLLNNLDLMISEGTRAIGPERIKPTLNHPLPMTLRQLRGFGGITGFCCVWNPGYGELARPLYKLIAETQQA